MPKSSSAKPAALPLPRQSGRKRKASAATEEAFSIEVPAAPALARTATKKSRGTSNKSTLSKSTPIKSIVSIATAVESKLKSKRDSSLDDVDAVEEDSEVLLDGERPEGTAETDQPFMMEEAPSVPAVVANVVSPSVEESYCDVELVDDIWQLCMVRQSTRHWCYLCIYYYLLWSFLGSWAPLSVSLRF